MRNTSIAPTNSFLREIKTLSPFLRAVTKFFVLSSALLASVSWSNWLSSQLYICVKSLVPHWKFLVVWTTIPHLIGYPSLWFHPQMPHWELLAVVLHFWGISLQFSFVSVCWFSLFSTFGIVRSEEFSNIVRAKICGLLLILTLGEWKLQSL